MESSKVQEFLKTARDRWDESTDAQAPNQANYDHDVRFENGEQWTDREKKERAGRPCVTNNKVAGTVKQILGDARQNRPRIKFRPVDSESDPLTALIFTGLARNIENVSDADDAYDYGHSCSVRGNIGYWRVNTRYTDDDSFDQDITIDRIVHTEAVRFDQASIKTTYEDSEYCLMGYDMRTEKFKVMYPKAKASDFQDGQSNTGWFSKDTIRVAEYFYKEPATKSIFQLVDGKVITIKNPKIIQKAEVPNNIGVVIDRDSPGGDPIEFRKMRSVKCHKVMWAKISGSEILEGPQEWPGKYIPIIPCLGEEIWINGERVLRSAIRHAVEPQKLYNWASSNNMEYLALAPKQPWILTPEQLGDYKPLWDTAYARPMPYLLWNFVPNQPPPQRLTGSTADTGALSLMQAASEDIKYTTQVFDAAQGAQSNEKSGIAIRERKAQSGTATFTYTDNQMRAIKYTGKILSDLIPKIYDGERVVRLMGDDLKKSMAKHMQEPMVDNNGKPLINFSQDGTEGWARINYKDSITGKTYNDLSIGKYDIVVDAGPGYATKRQEAADGMIQLTNAAPQFMPILVPRIAKNLDWPDADDIGDEIKAATQPQQQPPPPPDPRVELAVKKGELDLQKGQLDIQGKQLDLASKQQGMQGDQNEHIKMIATVAHDTTLGVLQQLGLIK